MRTRITTLVVLLVATAALAAKNTTDLPVTTNISDFNASGVANYIQSDGGGAYTNGVSGVVSVLQAPNFGNWLLDLENSTVRTVAVTFSAANEVQPGDPSFTAPANPPYLGTKFSAMRMINSCSLENHHMFAMKPGDKFTCNFAFRFPFPSQFEFYRLDMDPSGQPETQQPQVSCNSSASDGNCNDWFIDPVPVVNPDGSVSPGQTRARLDLVKETGKNQGETNEGDFYLTFHIHITRP